MAEKRTTPNQSKHASFASHEEPAPDFARGSNASVTAVSQPRTPSRAPLSAFQLPEARRQSEHEITLPPPAPTNERAYLAVIIALMFCTVGVLVFLLLV